MHLSHISILLFLALFREEYTFLEKTARLSVTLSLTKLKKKFPDLETSIKTSCCSSNCLQQHRHYEEKRLYESVVLTYTPNETVHLFFKIRHFDKNNKCVNNFEC